MPLRFPDHAQETYRFPLILGRLLDAALITAPGQEIVYRDRCRLTYRELRVRIGRLASCLTALGAAQGTTVAVLDWDSHRYLECYFAIPMMGAVLQTVNVRLSPTQITYTLVHSKAEILLVHADFVPLLERILPALQGLRAIVVMDDGNGAPMPASAAGEYESLLAQAPEFAFQDFDENALATTFYTTGTTGNPKGVAFTHRQLVLHTLACSAVYATTGGQGLGIDDVYMPLTPMFHVHAWGVPYLATMLGIKQVYPGRYDPDLILELRNREGVTFSHCVPAILQMMLTAAERRSADLTGWKMTIGGSALTQTLYEQARRRGMRIAAGYGMSESGPTISIARRCATSKSGSSSDAAALTKAGLPMPLVSVRIVDESMQDLPADGMTSGEMVVRAPWLTAGYTGDISASNTLWRGGWLHTQDIATMDSDGCLTIRDRMKDVIKSGGEWVSSLALEEILENAEGVERVAVIGVPDPRWGERPIGIVVPREGSLPGLAALNEAIDAAIGRGELSAFARLDRIEIVDSLPLTSVGKVDKKQLRKLFPG
jgi:fatty-acyl-CoA synthase